MNADAPVALRSASSNAGDDKESGGVHVQDVTGGCLEIRVHNFRSSVKHTY